MTRKTEPPFHETLLAEVLKTGRVSVPRREFGAATIEATLGDCFPEVDGGRQAQFRHATALVNDDDEIVVWASAEELRLHGDHALRPPRGPQGPMVSVDSASAGAVIAERFGAKSMEACGYRVVDCGSGIALLDVRNHLVGWLNALQTPAPAHDCPHCRCGHAPALPGLAAR